MKILITQRHSQNIHGDWIDSLENNYISYFEKYGMDLIPVPNATERIEELVRFINPDGIILSGGGDVSSELNRNFNNGLHTGANEREKREAELLETAIRYKIPVLGICRGMQFINVFFGGSLCRSIGLIDPQKIHSAPGIHLIQILNNDLSALLHKNPNVEVNSYHDMGVLMNTLGKDLRPFAIFEELNIVEGFYHVKHPIAAVEWHPERPKPSDSLDDILINAFLGKRLFWRS